MLYSELQCSEAIHKAVERMGFAEMTEIQEKTIPVMMAGYDVIAKAPTGTGKTCAFGIPVAEHILPENKYPQAVIMAPTRELAQQIAQELEELLKQRILYQIIFTADCGRRHRLCSDSDRGQPLFYKKSDFTYHGAAGYPGRGRKTDSEQ